MSKRLGMHSYLGMLTKFFEPRFFNCVILALYAMAAVRWGIAGKWADTCYWICAFGITATVTFLFKH